MPDFQISVNQTLQNVTECLHVSRKMSQLYTKKEPPAGGSFYEQDYRKGTAFLIGNEGNGLSEQLTDLSEHKIKIPMKGQVESLNAAMAAGILMYETLRQRI